MEVWSPSQQTALFIWDTARGGRTRQPAFPLSSTGINTGTKPNDLQQQSPHQPPTAPEELWPAAAPTLVDDALCDKFALPPLVITQRPPVENQASPEVLLKAKEVLGQAQQGHQGTRVEQSDRTGQGQDLYLQRQLHPQ